jgi:hypothetical protein
MCWILPNGGADEDPEPALEHATSVAKITIKPAERAVVDPNSAIFPRITVCLSLLAKTVLRACLGGTLELHIPKWGSMPSVGLRMVGTVLLLLSHSAKILVQPAENFRNELASAIGDI